MGFFDQMKKGIAAHTIVLVAMIGMFAIASFAIFSIWAETNDIETTVATCSFKKALYCSDWRANNFETRPWAWNSRDPTGCSAENIGIDMPSGLDGNGDGIPDDCEGLV